MGEMHETEEMVIPEAGGFIDVDKRVIALVRALNMVPGIITSSSCEGDRRDWAQVYFFFKEYLHADPDHVDRQRQATNLAICTSRIHERLQKLESTPHYLISVDYFNMEDSPEGAIQTEKCSVDTIAQIIEEHREEFTLGLLP